MDFFEINSQGKLWIQRVADIDLIGHTASDERRLVYSESDEKVYIGTSTEWRSLAIEYSVLQAGAKMLFGSLPLPVGWNIQTHNDMIVIITNDSDLIGNDEEGSWVITGIGNSQPHTHTGLTGLSTAIIDINKYDAHSVERPNWAHQHTIVSDGIHTHSFGSSWRPAFINFVEGELQ